MNIKLFVFAALVSLGLTIFAYVPPSVVFNAPAKDESGAMLLGNGVVGATAWVDEEGVLHTVLQHSDSWNEGGRHVKTGAIDYDTKSPVDAGTFRQELSMANGEFEASWKSAGRDISLRYRIQQGTDSIAVCDVKGALHVEAKVVNWRLYPGGVKEFGVGSSGLDNRFAEAFGIGMALKDRKFLISADRLVPGGWCHVNRNETVAQMMKDYDFYQGTGNLGKPDYLSDRVFGGVTRKFSNTKGGVPRVLFLSAVTCYHPCRDEGQWLGRTNEEFDRNGWSVDEEDKRRLTHIAWWKSFWNRSHIELSPSTAGLKNEKFASYDFPINGKLPLSIGIDSKGDNKFHGKISFAEVKFGGKTLYSGEPMAKDIIQMKAIDTKGDGAFCFMCKFQADRLDVTQRLLDNITPGGCDGFSIDIHDGRIRGIFKDVIFSHSQKIMARKEIELKVSVSDRGMLEMSVNGSIEKKNLMSPIVPVKDECYAVTLCYAAQRYLTAAAGKGRFPIRFNGSLFTVSYNGDPDYRRWGHGYWWQNTRLPYYPMFAAGDVEFTEPLFNMYLGNFEFFKKRTKKYFGHRGAFFPECMQPWGDHFMGSYGAECEWRCRKDAHQFLFYHKYLWVGQLELSLMAIMRWQHTRDDAWFKDNALEPIREFVRFYDEHYKIDSSGKYVMHPSQALETWSDCVNSMPDVAGLTRVSDLMLAMPESIVSGQDRAFFESVRSRVPVLPTRKLDDGDEVFAPAHNFKNHTNVESPEMYAVFPFRLSSFEKTNAELGRRTYNKGRFHRLYNGWAQSELNAAYLGLTEEARKHIVARVFKSAPEVAWQHCNNGKNIVECPYSLSKYRWPAYWGPNFDWLPDQTEGGVFQDTIQSMLMQYDGDKIYLLPAWPRAWNCSFKLNAPGNTVIEGRVVDGVLKDLLVTPSSRIRDINFCWASQEQ